MAIACALSVAICTLGRDSLIAATTCNDSASVVSSDVAESAVDHGEMDTWCRLHGPSGMQPGIPRWLKAGSEDLGCWGNFGVMAIACALSVAMCTLGGDSPIAATACNDSVSVASSDVAESAVDHGLMDTRSRRHGPFSVQLGICRWLKAGQKDGTLGRSLGMMAIACSPSLLMYTHGRDSLIHHGV